MTNSPSVTIHYWSSTGELGLYINGKYYRWEGLDVACIHRFKYLLRDARKPGAALAYIKSIKGPVRKSNGQGI
jgi:hypothetical protein